MSFEMVKTAAMYPTGSAAKLSYLPTAVDKDDRELLVEIPLSSCQSGHQKMFAFLVGTKADSGKIRVNGVVKDGVMAVVADEYLTVNFGYVPEFGKLKFNFSCPFAVIDDDYELSIPVDLNKKRIPSLMPTAFGFERLQG